MGLRVVRCGAFEAKSSSSKGKQIALPVSDNKREMVEERVLALRLVTLDVLSIIKTQ